MLPVPAERVVYPPIGPVKVGDSVTKTIVTAPTLDAFELECVPAEEEDGDICELELVTKLGEDEGLPLETD